MNTSRFKQLLESTLGNVKPLLVEDDTTNQINIDSVNISGQVITSAGMDSDNLKVRGNFGCKSCVSDVDITKLDLNKVSQAIGDDFVIKVLSMVDGKLTEVFSYKLEKKDSLIFDFEMPKQSITNLQDDMPIVVAPKKNGSYIKSPEGKNIMTSAKTFMV